MNIPASNRHSFPLVVRGNRSLLIAVNKGYTGNWLINQLNDVYLILIVGDICVFLSNNRRGREVDGWSTGGFLFTVLTVYNSVEETVFTI